MLVNKVIDDAYHWNGHDVVNSIDGVFFYRTFWAFSDLVAAISAALHATFVLSQYANSVSQFCYIYKDFVRQLKAFPPSLCQFCACETSPGWGHLITWMDHSVGHLNGILARVGGNLNKNWQKKSSARGFARGGHVEASIWPIHYTYMKIHSNSIMVCISYALKDSWKYLFILCSFKLKPT